MNSVSKNILDLLKVVAENQIQLAKKVDTMNQRLNEFFDEASTEPPVDLGEFSIERPSIQKQKLDAQFNDLVLKEKERRKPKTKVSESAPKKKKISESNTGKVRILKAGNSDPYDISGVSEDELINKPSKPQFDKIKPSDSTREKLRKMGMELPSLENAIPELADIEKAKKLESQIEIEQKKADKNKPKEEQQ